MWALLAGIGVLGLGALFWAETPSLFRGSGFFFVERFIITNSISFFNYLNLFREILSSARSPWLTLAGSVADLAHCKCAEYNCYWLLTYVGEQVE